MSGAKARTVKSTDEVDASASPQPQRLEDMPPEQQVEVLLNEVNFLNQTLDNLGSTNAEQAKLIAKLQTQLQRVQQAQQAPGSVA